MRDLRERVEALPKCLFQGTMTNEAGEAQWLVRIEDVIALLASGTEGLVSPDMDEALEDLRMSLRDAGVWDGKVEHAFAKVRAAAEGGRTADWRE